MSENFYIIARAGGGQHFSSSPSSGTTSSSTGYPQHNSYYGNNQGSSSGGGILGIILFILILPVLIIALIIYSLYRKRHPKNAQTFPPVQTTEMTTEISPSSVVNDPTVGLSKIQSVDSNFNIQVFKDKTENAFYKIQEAWERQDMNIARPFVSDSIMQRYTTMISDMHSRGEQNILENIVIGSMTIYSASADNNFDYITVKIDASAADYTVNSEGQLISGSKSDQPFTEYWTMLRTVNTLTQADKQLKDNKCPNCGAPLQVNATGKCNFCGAIVSSGEYDWVLSQVDQKV